jgi:glutathione synthase/RimK-type ligase-like ATP-grasp enzyme
VSARVALVTAASARHLDEDLPPLEHSLAEAGLRPGVEVWDDPGVRWGHYDLVVLRSAWDYVARRRDLLDWAATVAAETRLANPPAVLEWCTDKRYLRDLQAAGVPVVPTVFLEPGDPVHVPPTTEVVVKPAISAGSADTERWTPEQRTQAAEQIRALQAAGRTVMLQPYLHGVDDHGETACVYFGGRYSHAIRKGAILRPEGVPFVEGLYAQEDIRPRTPSAEELAVAEAAMEAVPGGRSQLLYGRVDLVPGPDGGPVVLEMELAEPSVFVDHADGAPERFAAAVLDLLAAS